KDKIRQAGIPFAIPERAELPGRLDAVLEAIYAAFTQGWTEPDGTDVARRDLTAEALFLARLATELMPAEPEAPGPPAALPAPPARRAQRRRLGPAGRAGSRRVGCGDDRRSRGAAPARQHAQRHRSLSAGGCAAIGARRALPQRSRQLGGRGAAL